MAPESMKEMEWETFDMATATEELFNDFSRHVGRFFMSHTKKELFQKGVRKKMTLYPVQSAADIATDPHLKERGFWEGLEHPELEGQVLYPNLPFILSEDLGKGERRAPLIGEHNEEIYGSELGISGEEMITLKELGAI